MPLGSYRGVIMIRIRFSVCLVSCYVHIIVLLKVVIVTLPLYTVDSLYGNS